LLAAISSTSTSLPASTWFELVASFPKPSIDHTHCIIYLPPLAGHSILHQSRREKGELVRTLARQN
jgi:hypothetical protein